MKSSILGLQFFTSGFWILKQVNVGVLTVRDKIDVLGITSTHDFEVVGASTVSTLKVKSTLELDDKLKDIITQVVSGFFNNSKLPDDYLNLLCTSIRKKGYVYHFRTVLSKFNKNNGIKEVLKK